MRKNFTLTLMIFVLALAACRAKPVPPAPTAEAPPTATIIRTETAAVEEAATPAPKPEESEAGRHALPLGINLGFVNDRSREFVDVARTMKGWEQLGRARCPKNPRYCTNADIDDDGWPLADAQTVFLDVRPWGAWLAGDPVLCPNCADGDEPIDVSGIYKLSFHGKAILSPVDGHFSVENQQYDPLSNLTTADIVLTADDKLIYMAFTHTQRDANVESGGGISNVKLIRPGYSAETDQLFTDPFLQALAPFTTIRTMAWTGAPYDIPKHTDDDNTLTWSERNRPQWRQPQYDGVAWEHIIALANQTGKDIWINIPVHADDGYIRGLAELLHATLDPNINFYVEYSNEIWNPHFDQYQYNNIAALAETLTTDSALNADGEEELETLGRRRYIQRDYQISQIFAAVFGQQAINQRVRVVHTWFIAKPNQIEAQLQWAQATYGDPNNYLYAIAGGSYFFNDNMPEDIDVDEAISRLIKASDVALGDRVAMQVLADQYGLHHLVYEGGPDSSVQLKWDRPTPLLNTLIAANKDQGMVAVLLHDLWNNWFNHPQLDGDLFMYYDLAHIYSRWGMFGLTDDIANTDTPKFEAVHALTGSVQVAPPAPVALKAATTETAITLTWAPSFSAETYLIQRRTPDESLYSTIGNTAAPTFTDNDVETGATYIYNVVAQNEMGNGYSKLIQGSAEAAAIDEYVEIIFTATPPQIDGEPDALWQNSPAYPFTHLLRGTVDDDTDLSGTFQAAWDADNLYLLYTIHDDKFRPKIGDDPWNGDSVELFLDGGNEKFVYDGNDEQLIFTPGRDFPWTRNGRDDGVLIAFTETADGYRVEIAYPWQNIGVTPTDGLLIGLEAEVNDGDTIDGQRDGKLAWWAEIDKAWTNPALFGTAILTSHPP